MKKLFFTFFALLAINFAFSQTLSTFVLEDFESGAVTFTDAVNINPDGSMLQAVVNNPVPDAVNSSSKVWKWTRQTNIDDWAGFWAILKNEIPAGYSKVQIKFLRTNPTANGRIHFEGTVTKELLPVTPPTKTNQWEVLTYDLKANGVQNVKVLGIHPDYEAPSTVGTITYVDEIKFISENVTPPSTMVLFENSADNRFYDNSWMSVTTPSTVTAESWNPSDPTVTPDKLPVVTTPIHSSPNALKLEWKAATGGDFMVLVASIGWQVFDLSTMKTLKFWVNSPVALSKSVLPKLHLEAHSAPSGTPNVTGKILMGNYLTTDLAANTWTEVSIPLADFWAADATFTAKSNIKGLFFDQNVTDNVQHLMYMDDFVFYSATANVDITNSNKIKISYTNGELSISDYTGSLNIFDVQGRLLNKLNMFAGKAKIKLNKGVYIINTTIGNSKFTVY